MRLLPLALLLVSGSAFAANLPNLSPSVLLSSERVAPDESVQVTVSVKNIGLKRARAAAFNILVTNDAKASIVGQPPNVRCSSERIGDTTAFVCMTDLTAGASTSVILNVQPTVAGTIDLSATADPAELTRESSEADNLATASILVL